MKNLKLILVVLWYLFVIFSVTACQRDLDWEEKLYSDLKAGKLKDRYFLFYPSFLNYAVEMTGCTPDPLLKYGSKYHTTDMAHFAYMHCYINLNPSTGEISGYKTSGTPLDSLCESLQVFTIYYPIQVGKNDTISVCGFIDEENRIIPVAAAYASFRVDDWESVRSGCD